MTNIATSQHVAASEPVRQDTEPEYECADVPEKVRHHRRRQETPHRMRGAAGLDRHACLDEGDVDDEEVVEDEKEPEADDSDEDGGKRPHVDAFEPGCSGLHRQIPVPVWMVFVAVLTSSRP